MDERFHAYYSRTWEKVGAGDAAEAAWIEWIPEASLGDLIRKNEIQSAHSILAVFAALNLRFIGSS